MSEKEKAIVEGIAKLPDTMKERFLDKIEGAVMALDLLGKEETDERTCGESQKVD